MKHISLLIPEGDSSLSNLEATYKMFTLTNESLKRMGQAPVFNVQLVGTNMNVQLSNGIFSIKPNVTIDQVKKTDLIIIPAIHGDYKKVVETNKDFVPWIVEQYRQGAEVASLCIGAFLLAKTGLLEGRSCDKIITDEQGIYTSGGAYSSLNLNLYLVEKFAGRQMAILSSKIFEIDIDRDSQSPFIIFKGQKTHDDETILEAQEYIESNFQERITVDELCDKHNVGRRTFERRFKKATSNTVMEYLQRVKMEAAKKELETGRKTVSEVMYDVGYSDTKAFRDVFKKMTGLTPIEYRNRYNTQVA